MTAYGDEARPAPGPGIRADMVPRGVYRFAASLPGFHLARRLLSYIRAVRWTRGGMQGTPPFIVKHAMIRATARRANIRHLVETGTYLGDTILDCASAFESVVSIEYDPFLAARAIARFGNRSKVRIVRGDSREVLPAVIATLPGPALFWLDAHFAEGITSAPAGEAPVMDELRAILRSEHVAGSAILIDDARLFVGAGGYPPLQAVAECVAEARPDFTVSVIADVIRIGRADSADTSIPVRASWA
jgi:hypothetical protein